MKIGNDEHGIMSREPRISRNDALQRDVITIQFFLRQQQNQEPLTKK